MDVPPIVAIAASPHDTAAQFHSLWDIYLAVTLAVGVAVVGMILLTVARFARRSRRPSPTGSAHKTELTYVICIAVIVAGLLAATFHTENGEDALAGTPALRVSALGAQWVWQFRYPNGYVATGANTGSAHPQYATLTVPAGEPVEFSLRSADVLHSFFIPAMRFKRYAFPNVTNRFVLTFPHPGHMLGECAQFCGWDHAEMRFEVVILSASSFHAWLQAHRPGGAA